MPVNTPPTQSPDAESAFQTKVITTVIQIAILGAGLFLATSLIAYCRKGQSQSLIAMGVSLTLLLVGFCSLRLVKKGKFKLARRIFLFAYFLRVVQLMLFISENLFPISVIYMTVFVVLGIFLSGPRKGFFWINLGVGTSITIILIRPFTHFPVTAIQDPITHALALYFLPLACLGVISLLCVYIHRQFHQTLLESLDARQQLEQTNKTLENFAHIASHDLQEPLRTITTYTQLLEREYRGKLDKNADEQIRFIVESVQRMRQLIKDLLQYSLLKTQKVVPQPTNLNEVMILVLKNLKSTIEETDAILDIGYLPTVAARPIQMTQLFQNLIGNALKFRSEQTPQIEVSAKPQGKNWLFVVKDNGIGIQLEHYQKIFQTFQRLHTQQKYQGSGIGLSIAQEIVTNHHGRIWVESEFEKGSTFFFTLPGADLAS